MRWRDLLAFALYLGTFIFLLWCLFAGADIFFGCGLTAEEQAGLIPLANGGWGH